MWAACRSRGTALSVKAVVQHAYGDTDVLELTNVDMPTVGDDEVLIRVHASSVNSWDWDLVRGTFQGRLGFAAFREPKITILGADVAGRIEAIGSSSTRFEAGDEVFGDISGRGWGGFAEYVSVREDVLALKSGRMTFDQATATPQAAVLALQGLRKVQIHPGDTVLINGAGGGVGTFAVQIAKSFGAVVTGVDVDSKLDMITSLGADHVIDCDRQDFARNGNTYDLILDLVASRSARACRRALSETGTYVVVGGSTGSLLRVLAVGVFMSRVSKKKLTILAHKPDANDLAYLTGLFEAGTISPVIDRRYPLHEVAEALRHFGEGNTVGKIVISVIPEATR